MLAFREFANFINLNMANLATTYARLLAEQNQAYTALASDSEAAISSATTAGRKLLKAVIQAFETQTSEPLLRLFQDDDNNKPNRWADNIDAPQPLIAIECLGQTLTPVVTNLEAGKFLWRLLAEARTALFQAVAHDYVSPSNQVKEELPVADLGHKQIQEALDESEERFQQVILSISDHIYVTEVTKEKELINLYLSPHITSLTGYALQKFMEDWSFWPSLIHPDDKTAAAEQAARLMQGQNSSLEYRLTRANGDIIWVRDSGQTKKDTTRQSITIYGIVSDITKQKQAEQALRQSQEQMRAILNNALDALIIIIIDADGVITEWNDQAETIFGWSRQDIIGRRLSDTIIPPQYREAHERGLKHYLATNEGPVLNRRIEITALHQQGDEFPIELTISPTRSGDTLTFSAFIRDITHQKQTGEALRESERRYRGLFEDSPISLWEEDFSAVKAHLDNLRRGGVEDFRAYFEAQPEAVGECAMMVKIIDVNRATLELYKAGSKEEFFAGLGRVFGEESLGAFKKELIAITEGETRLQFEAVNYTLTGERKVLDLTWTVAPGYENNLSKVLVSIIDITQQKQVQEALQEEEARYRSLFEDSPISLWEEDFSAIKAYFDQLRREGVTDFRAYFEGRPEAVAECAAKVKIVSVNRATLELFHARTMAEFFGGLGQIFGEKSFEIFQEELIAYADGQTRFESEAINYTLTGERKDLVLRAFVVPGHEETLSKVLITMIDVTERKRLEREIQVSLERRTRQVETGTKVAQEISLAPILPDLFRQVVNLVQKQFNYYHAHIYTLEEITSRDNNSETERYLILQEGTGEAGRQMKAAGHKIALTAEQSLVARAARTGQPVLIPDVSQAPSWLPNPLLPRTRSELSVPIKLGDTVLGVLDAQSDAVGGLGEEDQLLLMGLCGQFAVAINSRRLSDQMREALLETQALQRFSQKLAGSLHLDEILDIFFRACTEDIGFEYVQFSVVDKAQHRIKAIAGAGISESQIKQSNRSLDSADIMADVIRSGQTEVISGWDERFDREIFETEGHADWVRVFTPITVRGEHIGLVEAGFNKSTQPTIQESQVRSLRAFIDQVALALDNARRYEAQQKVARREQMIREITEKMRAAASLDELVKTTAEEMGRRFSAAYAFVELGAVKPGKSPVQFENGHNIAIQSGE
jgi:PAS domain S-box-containing protein